MIPINNQGGFIVKALDVARYFISKSVPGTPENITNLKLQKILYYAQGLYLVHVKKPLFEERIEAWVHGPVVPEVYHQFKQYGYNEIKKNPQNSNFSLPNPEVKKFLDGIWDKYKKYTGKELENKTHQEEPWLNARGDLPEFISSSNTITQEDLLNYFNG